MTVTRNQQRQPRRLDGVLSAAARTALDVDYAVRVLVPRQADAVAVAQAASELAGVDVYCEADGDYLSVQFVARHQDRRATPLGPLSSAVLASANFHRDEQVRTDRPGAAGRQQPTAGQPRPDPRHV